jgi:Fe-S-cluster containining protein
MAIHNVLCKSMKEVDMTERHSLRSGIPCVSHECVTCCLETEMPLSQVDIRRLFELGHRLEDFAVKSGNEWHLKNQNGRCVFLSANGCTIYSHRPDGCRIYPLVYDETQRKAVLHQLCPHRHEFEVRPDDIENLRRQLKSLNNQQGSDGI